VIHLVTGAGSGIGSALARRLLDRGDELWLLARDAGRARALAAEFPGARTLVGDLAEPSRLSWALGHQSPPDRLDSLLHVAGTVELGAVGDLTPKVCACCCPSCGCPAAPWSSSTPARA
jgi:NADP-dependent 3-hydroxy acid dehydrogenase YdfG